MAKGYCYVIYCEGFPEWVKVGLTTRKPSQRLAEYQTYSPHDYELRYVCQFDDVHAAEKEIHQRLEDITQRKREWFKISPVIAANMIDGIKEELDTWGCIENPLL